MTAERKRTQWREAQSRRREREKKREAVFGLALNPDLVAAAVMAKYPTIDPGKLAGRKVCESALSLMVTEHLVFMVRSSGEPALRERDLIDVLKTKIYRHA
ncbi:hypothetical protein EN742_24620 [Mesorhizobium sp. M4A.F.Ca.ET.020.02.1.1]|uniref:hypothetical protein n=1 Tax=unclassified Mesorhizobium TaxID=325217 RepID=UPI000FD2BD1D|nr:MULTISPECIES: hypothetical protein [unclassified Mesorhizobium]RVD35613.1 hypothetical protein EN742_24620 [Mesorhizobium sp. M4A.F.Ca.ET.020.02.1.1]RWC20319.1 MAG: hypothetical protein EOS53_10030 [Mesorhizobium sp.]TGQ35332.1 hypothetical protein EN857_19830 [Mesorhizobium sp. M4B.F.Ca.ET.214.01.1.1]